MGLAKPPLPDEKIEPFRGGAGVLTRDGQVAGYVATTVTAFWSPSHPFRKHWWVWMIVVWSDGVRERSTEDYAPWTYVEELVNGFLEWEDGGLRHGRYEFAWLSRDEAEALRFRLGVTPEDF